MKEIIDVKQTNKQQIGTNGFGSPPRTAKTR